MPAQSVKAFVHDAYRLITSGSPTVPLHGDDTEKAVQYMNELISYYSATGLLNTIAQLVETPLVQDQAFISFAAPGFIIPASDPHPEIAGLPATVQIGRLSNMENAWLSLMGVDYPLFEEDRNVFFGSYKYYPLKGLPRYVIITNQTNYTTMQLYPKPSQSYDLHIYGKFEGVGVLESGDMSGFPNYYIRYLRFALAKDLSLYKSRSEAWTDKLEAAYIEAKDLMEAQTPINLTITTQDDSMLWGVYRARAGV
jgi:hypothetical protein